MSEPPGPTNVTLYGKRIFAEAMKLKTLNSGWASNPMTDVLRRPQGGDFEMQRHTERKAT